MYFSYLDESESDRKKVQVPYFVLSAVLVNERVFGNLEIMSSIVVEDILPEERRASFKEFHAYELFNGYGVFDGIDRPKRFHAIETLLNTIVQQNLTVVTSIVDLTKLRSTPFGSALPSDVAFRDCAAAINSHIRAEQPTGNFSIVIMDEHSDRKVREELKSAFRTLRPHLHETGSYATPGLWNLHDSMYFGDSRDSIGLQLADLCSYFIRKHEEKHIVAESFYKLFDHRIVHQEKLP